MLSRTTQTNEPARCAVLLPLLCRLPQPIALIEVGASAGLCLLPDKYTYNYGKGLINPAAETPQPPVFTCEAHGPVPLPDGLPQIVWRRGLDLNPLDVHDADDMAWLQTLVWPEQHDRANRLEAAITVAREDPPLIMQGNLLTDLDALMAEAPKEATLVVFHTAVLAYLPDVSDRNSFAEAVSKSRAAWISNETPGAFPHIAERLAAPRRQGRFLLSLDGEPVAWTGPHGQSLDWIA